MIALCCRSGAVLISIVSTRRKDPLEDFDKGNYKSYADNQLDHEKATEWFSEATWNVEIGDPTKKVSVFVGAASLLG